jgi:hypothetical protein
LAHAGTAAQTASRHTAASVVLMVARAWVRGVAVRVGAIMRLAAHRQFNIWGKAVLQNNTVGMVQLN